jgi:hypothetical protein
MDKATDSKIKNAIRLAIAEDDPSEYSFIREDYELGFSNKDVDRVAEIASIAIEGVITEEIARLRSVLERIAKRNASQERGMQAFHKCRFEAREALKPQA